MLNVGCWMFSLPRHPMRRPLLSLCLAALLACPVLAVDKPRVFILTDISSLAAGEREPDDGQSLIRLLLYSHTLDIEGLAASSNLGHGQVVRPGLIRQAIQAYDQVRPNLLLHRADFPSAERLDRLVKSGQPVAGPAVRVNDSIGRGKDTEASDALIAAVDREDPRPLWICAWGGTADLAQALWKVRAERSGGDLAAFLAKLRIHAIADQDSTGRWLRENFPTLHYTLREVAYRGMYRGGDPAPVSAEWVEKNVRTGHGRLGGLYPSYRGGDIWSSMLGPVQGVKEGDTPSFLGLIPNGLNVPGRIGLSSWGGRLEGPALRPVDARSDVGEDRDPDPRIAAVYRWRRAFQADFQARLDWCVKPATSANHAPEAGIRGETRRTVKPGESLQLDASTSSDPDLDRLRYEWLIDLPAAELAGCQIEGADTAKARLVVPAGVVARELPLLLIVRDEGEPALEGYARIEVAIER